jgi:hypothetical protein
MSMKETPVDRNAQGRYNIPGGRNVELDLGANDFTKLVVLEKELDPALPKTYERINIQWFAAFGIRRLKADKTMGDYADISYTVSIDALPADKRLFAYYGGQIHEITDFNTDKNKTRFTLTVGDPPIGFGP